MLDTHLMGEAQMHSRSIYKSPYSATDISLREKLLLYGSASCGVQQNVTSYF